jgi:hypothetical protein
VGNGGRCCCVHPHAYVNVPSTTNSLLQHLRRVLMQGHDHGCIFDNSCRSKGSNRRKRRVETVDDREDYLSVVATFSGLYVHPVKCLRAVWLSESFLDSGRLAHVPFLTQQLCQSLPQPWHPWQKTTPISFCSFFLQGSSSQVKC